MSKKTICPVQFRNYFFLLLLLNVEFMGFSAMVNFSFCYFT